jgi:hypothetical protein
VRAYLAGVVRASNATRGGLQQGIVHALAAAGWLTRVCVCCVALGGTDGGDVSPNNIKELVVRLVTPEQSDGSSGGGGGGSGVGAANALILPASGASKAPKTVCVTACLRRLTHLCCVALRFVALTRRGGQENLQDGNNFAYERPCAPEHGHTRRAARFAGT